MNTPQIFNFEQNEVRTILFNDEPYFVGKDIADVLGYSNTAKAIRDHVDIEDRRSERIVHPSGGAQDSVLINESGLYSLILKSKLPNAKKFKRWVTSEVLPAIRKHGGYLTPDKIEEVLSNPDTIIQLATQVKMEREKRLVAETGKLVAEQRVMELQPKADYYDMILANKSLVNISIIAKNYGMSGRAMNGLLHDYGVQYQQSGTWLLYAKYQAKGYTHTEMKPDRKGEGLYPSTKWTTKGHIFIYELLKKHDVYPTIETLFEQEA
ncbi:BRO family protein [Enterococcus songbeiensis]